MKTHTTPTSIELLMPQIPKEGEVLEFTQNFLYYKEGCIQHGINLMHPPTNGTILGTCWYEGDKLVCDFDPSPLLHERVVNAFKTIVSSEKARLIGYCNHLDTQLKEWGITIDEGFKRVIIKVS